MLFFSERCSLRAACGGAGVAVGSESFSFLHSWAAFRLAFCSLCVATGTAQRGALGFEQVAQLGRLVGRSIVVPHQSVNVESKQLRPVVLKAEPLYRQRVEQIAAIAPLCARRPARLTDIKSLELCARRL